ncbi:MAG: DUF3520 domain-containing protein [Lachnospiraceae bacterium]|nr:DUF3520 domain-containing protein [Lachnospiraceae bacterium]
MKKRFTAAVLSAVLAAGALSGCGAGRNSDVPPDKGNMTAEEAPAGEPGQWYNVGEAADGGYYEEAPAEWDAAEPESESYAESCYQFDVRPENSEEYSQWEEKGFSSVLNQPLSTFAADVDTASYSNLRRLITDGYSLDEIPERAVRVEEMLNYFTYDHKEPEGSEPFGVTTVISRCPWNEEAQLLMVGLKTEDVDYSDVPASNLVFLLDVSGSMGDYDKLPLLQEAFGILAENLTGKDRISIVTYASEDKVVLEGVSGDKTSKIKRAINSLKAGGGTYGSKGIETAYRIAEDNFIEGGNNRIILATDGDLNIGMTTEEELEELISEKRESGIFLSVLGFGTGNIKDNKMETLADKGNGNYAYIDSMREAKKVLEKEMTANLLTICKDVKLQVEFNPAVVEGYRLIGYENRALDRKDFNDDTKDAGEIGAGHSVTAMYELILKDPLMSMSEEEIAGLKYGDNYKEELGDSAFAGKAMEEEWLTISIRYKKPAEDTSNLLQYPVDFDSYTYEPGEDFRFAAAVAEFGLLAAHSDYPEDASVEHVLSVLKGMDLEDEYKAEFEELVQEVR